MFHGVASIASPRRRAQPAASFVPVPYSRDEERVELGDEAVQLVSEAAGGRVLEEREEQLVAGAERLVVEPLLQREPGRLDARYRGRVAHDEAAVAGGSTGCPPPVPALQWRSCPKPQRGL